MVEPLPTRFLAPEYRAYRPEYPAKLFEELQLRLKPFHLNEPRSLLDLGCGSGQSAESFLRHFPSVRSVTLVDPDPGMIHESRARFSPSSLTFEYKCSKAEAADLGVDHYDRAIVGSAFHWMSAEKVIEKISSHVKGFIFVFEYQFPRAINRADLNDWIRKKFNTEWKAPAQRPRGSFRELLFPLDRALKRTPFSSPEWKMPLTFESFMGQVFSQSRYLHSEAELTANDVRDRRHRIEVELKGVWGDAETLDFDFYLDGALYIIE